MVVITDTQTFSAVHAQVARGYVAMTSATDGERDLLWHYTTGNYNKGLPELLLFAVSAESGAKVFSLLHQAMHVLADKGQVALGELDIGMSIPVYLTEVSADIAAPYMAHAMRNSDNKAKVLQVHVPLRGQYPWQGTTLTDSMPVLGDNPVLH